MLKYKINLEKEKVVTLAPCILPDCYPPKDKKIFIIKISKKKKMLKNHIKQKKSFIDGNTINFINFNEYREKHRK